MDWQKLFKPHILDRGYDYYCDGAVDNLVRNDGLVTATVYGTEVYDVELSFDGDKITGLACSCPYAAGENSCKHMAAVLYELDDAPGNEAEEADVDGVFPGKEFSENDILISFANEEVLRKFVREVLDNDATMKNRLKNIMAQENSKHDIGYYKRQVDRIDRKYGGRDGCIDYNAIGDYIWALEGFLSHEVHTLLNYGRNLDAFTLTNYVFTTATNADFDDSDGWLSQLIQSVIGIWEAILETCDGDEKRVMFHWFGEHLNCVESDLIPDAAEEILMRHFLNQEFIGDMLALTDQKIEAAIGIDHSWQRQYEGETWAKNHLLCMEADGRQWKELEAYCRKNWELSTMRAYYIEKQIQEKDYGNAIAALRESMVLDQDYKGLVRSHSLRLKEIYGLTGRKEEYVSQLWQLMLEDDPGDLDIYRELRDQYTPEEWALRRERVFAQLSGRVNLDVFYQEDKLYDRLLEYVLKVQGLFTVEKYHRLLKKKYPEALLEKYEAELEAMALYSSDRSCYRDMVRILRKMGQLEGGKEKALEIAARWKQQYRRRRAMMEELAEL